MKGHDVRKSGGHDDGSPDILLIWAIHWPNVFPSRAFGCYWSLTSNGSNSLNQQKLGRTTMMGSRTIRPLLAALVNQMLGQADLGPQPVRLQACERAQLALPLPPLQFGTVHPLNRSRVEVSPAVVSHVFAHPPQRATPLVVERQPYQLNQAAPARSRDDGLRRQIGRWWLGSRGKGTHPLAHAR
jgi:hypothetical protein